MMIIPLHYLLNINSARLPCNRFAFLINKLRSNLRLGTIFLVILFNSAYCLAELPSTESMFSDPKCFLELSKEIFYQVNSDRLIKCCTDLLTKRQSLNNKHISKIYYGRAIAFHRNKNYQRAMSDYDNAVKNDPNNYSIQRDRAICLAARGDRASALQYVHSILKNDPKYSPAHSLASIFYIENDDRGASLQHANEAIKSDENNAEALFQRAFLLISYGVPKQALSDINRCIMLAPLLNNSPIPSNAPYELRGGLRLLFHDYKLAVADYSMAIFLDPSSFFAWHGLCGTYYNMKQFHISRYHSEKFVKLYPRRPTPYQDLAAALAKLDDMDEALKMAKMALELDKNESGSHFQVASIATLLKDYGLAVKHYTLSIELAPEKTTSSKSLVLLLACCPDAKFRDGKKALLLAKTLCADERHADAESLLCLSIAYAECGLFNEAIDYIKKARDRAGSMLSINDDCTRFLTLFQQKHSVRLIDLISYFQPVARNRTGNRNGDSVNKSLP